MDGKNNGTSNGTKNGRKTKIQLQEELTATRNHLKAAKAEIKSLKETLAEYESEKTQFEQSQEDIIELPEEAVSEEIAASKATFRIDLYPHQGHYQGKIEHLLTKQKKAFSDLDQNVIMDFISSHLPQLEEQVEETTPAVAQPAAEEQIEESTPAVVPSASQTPPSEAEAMVRLAIHVSNWVIPHDQPFQVQLTLDLTNIVERDIPLSYKTAIYAKHLEGGTRQIVAEFDDTITSAEVVSLSTKAYIPRVGTYRLEATLTSSLPEGTPAPYTAFVKSGLLQVY